MSLRDYMNIIENLLVEDMEYISGGQTQINFAPLGFRYKSQRATQDGKYQYEYVPQGAEPDVAVLRAFLVKQGFSDQGVKYGEELFNKGGDTVRVIFSREKRNTVEYFYYYTNPPPAKPAQQSPARPVAGNFNNRKW